jgi:hypothetical protein
MTDADSERIWMGDLPVREIQDSIASLETHPGANRATREQKVATAYAAATARVLLEQSELYLELLAYLESEGSSFPLLREVALDRARIIAELFLSARLEQVDLSAHAFPGQDPIGGLLALEAIKSCDVVLTGDDPDGALLLTADEIDHLLHNPLMDAWWERALPRDQEPPPRWGSGSQLDAGEPTDPAVAQATVILMADCVGESVADYRALLGGGGPDGDGGDGDGDGDAREQALRRALEITRLLHGNFALNIDFDTLDEALNPVPGSVVLKAIADSCTVFAAPAGDFPRYGMTADELDEALSDPALRGWLDAVGKLL